MVNRRNFIKQVAAVSIGATMSNTLFAKEQILKKENSFIWANLLHLSYNMWEDNTPPQYQTKNPPNDDCRDTRMWAHCYQPELTFDKSVWDRLLVKMVDTGMNMVIIDLGDGVKYESHPEIAVEGAWTPSQLKKELRKIREMGLEPIPKLNFSAAHKAWLGPYQRMISSQKYYEVCKNLIDEISYLFDTPRFFHLGMDEETAAHQKNHINVVVRQGDLWWNDFYYLVDIVEKQNIRPWIWSDYAWDHPDLFFQKMPKSVLQSNWYYEHAFANFENEYNEKCVKLYNQLETHGYDQVPTGSNHYNDINFERTVEYCRKVINPNRLKGFMQSVWRPTMEPCFIKHCDAIDQVKAAMHQA